jgi:fatty-acyl-CoA synthase
VRKHLALVPEYLGKLVELPVRLDALRKAGLFDPLRPDEGLRTIIAVRRLGPIAGPATVSAARHPDAVALVDERGPVTFGELDRRSNALARGWQGLGLGPDSVVAVLARDHRGLVECMLAAAKIGAKLLLMNTGFSKPQLADVAAREGVVALAHDEEFTDLLGDVDPDVPRFVAWTDGEPGEHSLHRLIEDHSGEPLRLPAKPGGVVLLTSGTTGTPKGAPRHVTGVLAATHFVERIPLRGGEATFIASPMFHATGLSQLILALALGSTVVVRRRFDPEATLKALQDNNCTVLVLVPTMLQRMLELPAGTIGGYDVRLRVILTAGSLLTPDVSNRAMDAFGDVVYNLYGSTEVAVATVATPDELRRAPGTAGRAPRGCVVRLYDPDGRRIGAPGERGRVFVGSELAFGGYTGGGHKEIVDGLLSSGDMGHFDESGLLFVDGRDDDMIVSGGENVFPGEIENLLVEHPDIADAVVIGVPDEQFGQRLKAFVVPRGGKQLDAEEIKKHVRQNLARYKVPREIVFTDELPRNATGKVLRSELSTLDARVEENAD